MVAHEILINHASLHLLNPSDDSYGKTLKDVLNYLNGKPALPRHLGAFSFVVSRFKNDVYTSDGTHFIIANPAYANVYFSFGGNNRAPIKYGTTKPILGNLFTNPMIEYSTQIFTSRLFDNFGKDTPFYCLPTPSGKDFDLVEEMGMLESYISAGIGPQMTTDLSAKMTIKRLLNIISYCADKKWLSDKCVVFHKIINLSYDFKVDLDILISVAECVGDYEYLEKINKYGNAFRLLKMNHSQINQLLALPENSVMNSDKLEELIRDAVFISKILNKRARELNEHTINYHCRQVELLYGKYSICYAGQEKNFLETSPIDMLVFSENDIVYVINSDLFYILEGGINPITSNKVNDSVTNTAHVATKRIKECQLLFPSGPAADMFEYTINPERSIFDVL